MQSPAAQMRALGKDAPVERLNEARRAGERPHAAQAKKLSVA
jgi:hypothetical protein